LAKETSELSFSQKGEPPVRIENAKHDIQNILSWFSEAFSSPCFKFFCAYVIGFIQLGKEAHTSSTVQSLIQSTWGRSLASFTRFLADYVWDQERLVRTAVEHFFSTLKIKAGSVLFLLVDDTLAQKTGKKIPGCGWHKDHANNLANVFGHQWVLSALLYKDFLFPLWANLYHPKGTKGCGRFQTKVAMVKKILGQLRFPIPCKVYLLADAWYWSKDLAQTCRQQGYHMISQLKSNATLIVEEKPIHVKTLADQKNGYREFSLPLYGKNKTLKIKKVLGQKKGFGKVALVIVKEHRKKPRFLISTNIYLSALDVVRYYAKRWKIEQMIKDLKQRLGFGDYQTRSLQAIVRHTALSLIAYFVLTILKIFQWFKDKQKALQFSIRFLAFQVRKFVLIELITVTLKNMKVSFKQNILDSYLEQLCV
jgi:Transposase DDE domain